MPRRKNWLINTYLKTWFGSIVQVKGPHTQASNRKVRQLKKRSLAADASIATGNLNPMEEVIENEKISELEESFNQVLRTQEFDTDDVGSRERIRRGLRDIYALV